MKDKAKANTFGRIVEPRKEGEALLHITRRGDVTILDGTRALGADPMVILDAATASKALDDGELEAVVDAALRALDLSGKSVVFVKDGSP
jgi:hypothetical protein